MKKTMKRMLAIMLVVVMTIGAAPLSGFVGLELPEFGGFKKLADSVSEILDDFSAKAKATATEISGNCGDNLTWTFDESTGELVISGTGDMYINSYIHPWGNYCDTIKIVTIGNGITSIGENAFWNCHSLTSVTIGNGVTSIGEGAFHDCDSLTSIIIPDSVASIGEDAFRNCDSLTNITVDSANTAYSSDEYGVLFNKDKTELIQYPKGNTRTSYVIPDSVTSISECVFAYCYSLTSITVDPVNTMYSSDEYGVLFNKDKTELIQYPAGNARTSYVIPDSVTSIGTEAFSYCTNLTSVTISNGVTSIGNWAFHGCKSFKSITIPDSVMSIGHGAFSYCTNLTSVTIGNGVTSINGDAFESCESLTSVTIGKGVRYIGGYAFDDCLSLETVTVLGNETSFENAYLTTKAIIYCYKDSAAYDFAVNNSYAYYLIDGTEEENMISGTVGTKLKWSIDKKSRTLTVDNNGTMETAPWKQHSNYVFNVKINYGCTNISNSAFKNCTYLRNIDIPDSVTSIGEDAFCDCDSLTSITIPDSVTSIGEGSFDDCDSLESITIPDSVTSIGGYAFEDCDSLTSITVDSENPMYSSDEYGVLFNKDKTELIQYPIGNTRTSYVIPNSVASIGDRAFEDCESLENVIIPDSVTSIDYDAFAWCDSLTSITVDPANSMYSSDEYGVLFNKDKTELIQYPAGNARTSYIIPDSVTSIYYYAFEDCESLENITIGNGVTSIDSFLWGCVNLTSITIPDSVTNIDRHAFENCDSLASITVDPANSMYSSDEYGVLFNKDKTELIQYPIGNTRTSYAIPNGVTSICDDAFENCDSLTSITIPDGVTSIGDNAFCYTAYYKDPSNWKNGVLYIGNYLVEAGSTVSGLCKVKYGTLTIADYAFYNCDSLTRITIPDSVTSIGRDAFSNCDSLTNVTIPDSVTSISYGAFDGCKSLTSITIPNNVTSIGGFAFRYCDSLTSITIPDSVTSIGDYAFEDCDSLTDVYYYGTEEQWNEITIGKNNECLTNATVWYYGYYFYLSKELVILDENEYFKFTAFLEDGTEITDLLTWKSFDEDVAEFVSPGLLLSKNNGSTFIEAEISKENCFGSAYCDVYVGKPNYVEYNTVYDEEYYYNGDGFYSSSSQISNAVDIYLSLKNCVVYEIYDHYGDYVSQNKCEEEFSSMEIGEFTVTATVSGNDLSFSQDEYSNIYSETFANIPLETIVDDMLILYPYGLTVSGDKKSYTVNIRIESDDFEIIEDTITFSVSDLASKSANEHIEYLDTNIAYKTSLHNSYGKNMVKLKDDKEYKFSKYSTFDFENYYEIVVGDMLIDILNVYQQKEVRLLPSVVTEYNKVIDKVISTVDTIVYDNYSDAVDISKSAIDEFTKISKYREDGIYAENVIFQAIQKACGNTGNAEKINKVFEKADDTKKVCGFFNFGIDTINNIIGCANRISVFNAYSKANNSFKEVFEKLYEFIPDSETKMKEALGDYINYADNGFDMKLEIIEACADFSQSIGVDAITYFLSKNFVGLISTTACNWIGMIPIKGGATFASTAAFSTVQAAFGGVVTGVAIGLCLTDLCCNSSKKAAEMSKIVAMSEYSPYIIEMIKYYENNLRTNKNNYSVELFENAFAIHKVSQVYIMDHTIKALEIKRDALIEKLFNREGEYERIITDTLSEKTKIECMVCHTNDTYIPPTRKTKVIAVKCPVDVFVYDEYGNIVVEIRNDMLIHCIDEIEVCIADSKKYICVPAEKEYEVKVVSTGEGTMDYVVFEYDENSNLQHKKVIENIPISTGDEFEGIIEADENDSQDCIYSLSGDSNEYYTEDDACVSEKHIKSVINYKEPSCTDVGYSGDIYCENCQKIVEYGENIELLDHSYQNGYCSVCGESDSEHVPEKPEYNYTFSIRTPSNTIINYGDSIWLHAEISGDFPAGVKIIWTPSNNNFEIVEVSADGLSCKITPKSSGTTTFTVSVVDANENVLSTDTQDMTSKAGLWQKIVAFFKKLFGATKTYPELFKSLF